MAVDLLDTGEASGRATLSSFWQELVTAGLLGTDRRDPPPVPPGPLADVVDDTARADPSQRMLAAVAACTAARRAGLRPLAPAAPLAPPPADPRPLLPTAAADRWRTLVAEWPVLEDEWLDEVARRGLRPSADVTVGLLRRHRADAGRRARVERVIGPAVGWLVDQLPDLAGTRPADDPDATRAILAVPPDLGALLDDDERTIAATVASGLAAGRLGPPHRAVLIHLVARVRPEALPRLGAALRAVDPTSPSIGLALALADLAELRRAMLDDLEPAAEEQP